MDPSQIRKEVEVLIRDLGGPNSTALVDRHPHAVKRGAVLVKAPQNDCLQRAVERVESRLASGALAAAATSTTMMMAGMDASTTNIADQQQGQQEQQAGGGQATTTAASPPATLAAASTSRLRRRPSSADSSTSSSAAFLLGGKKSSPSPIRGGVMSFRSNARLFLGTQFPCGAVDSPGPIYQYHGDGINTKNGVSFAKAPKGKFAGDPVPSSNAGPAYTGIPAIGKQFISNRENSVNTIFPRSMRFGEIKESDRTRNRGKGPYNVPGPGAFLSDILHLPHHRGGKASNSPAPSLGVRHSANQFISQMHFSDYQGRCSPGPLYDVSGKHRGVFPPSKAPSFGKGERIPLENRDKTPGPGTYAPKTEETTIPVPMVKFARSRRMMKHDNDSPGPIYTPTYDFSEKNAKVVKIGAGPEECADKDRFDNHVFLGKKLGVDAVGRDSPGPKYNTRNDKLDGPRFTITFKEPRVRPSLFPRPQRARWISEQSAKENLGAWSPGPKYDTRGDISKTGITYSFAGSHTDREAATTTTTTGTAAAAAAASSSSSAHAASDNSDSKKLRTTDVGSDIHGTDASTHAKVPFYNTDISALSTTKPVRSVVISRITERVSPPRSKQQQEQQQQQNTSGTTAGHNNNNSNSRGGRASSAGGRRQGGDDYGDQQNNSSMMMTQDEQHPKFYYPKDDLCHPSAPTFSFGRGTRSSTIWKQAEDKNAKASTVESNSTININWAQVETGVHGPRLGGLSNHD